MSGLDWKEIAPKRADWERLSAECEKRGIPRPSWVNGIPTGLTADEMITLEAVALGKAPPEAPPKKPRGRPVGWRKKKD